MKDGLLAWVDDMRDIPYAEFYEVLCSKDTYTVDIPRGACHRGTWICVVVFVLFMWIFGILGLLIHSWFVTWDWVSDNVERFTAR